ncbi:MAG: MASE3 domain-containing protein, partial [Marinobacterium sp.]
MPDLKRASGFLLLSLLLMVAALLIPHPEVTRGLANYLPLHTALEVVAVSVSLMVFAVGWNTCQRDENRGVIWLGCLFLGVAVLDLSHLLSYKGMPDFVTPSDPEKAINFWLAARSFAALGLVGAAVIFWRRQRLPVSAGWVLIPVLLMAVALHYLFLLHPERVPATFDPETGLTAFKIGFEYGLIAAYLLAATLFLILMTRSRTFNASGLFTVSILMAMSEIFFTLYADVTDIYNLLGHLYKILAYSFLYRALFVETVTYPWRQLQASERQLNATINALPDLLFEMDEAGNYLGVHASETGQLVVPIEQLLYKNVRDVMPKEAADSCLQAIREAERKGISRGHRLMLETPQGQRFFELSVSCRRSSEDAPVRYLVLSRDDTESVLQQQALEHQASLNESLLMLSREMMLRNEAEFIQYGAERARYLTRSGKASIFLVEELADARRLGAVPRQHDPLPPEMLHYLLAAQGSLMINDPMEMGQGVVLPEGLGRLISLPVIEAGR